MWRRSNGRLLALLGVFALILGWAYMRAGITTIRSARSISATMPMSNSEAFVDPTHETAVRNEWTQWRGGEGNGVASTAQPPITWGPGKNIRWAVDLPGRGHSSPIVWNGRCFLQTSTEKEQTQCLLAYDLKTGRQLWMTELHRGPLPVIHQKNTHASATPACDGTSVYTCCIHQGELWVSSVSSTGQIEWQIAAGPYSSEWGFGSSPVYWRGRLFVLADQRGAGLDRMLGVSYLAAIDCRSAQILWRIKRPSGVSYGTPCFLDHPQDPQLIVGGPGWLISYSPENGEERWRCPWSGGRTASTPVADLQSVFCSTSQPGAKFISVPVDRSGLLTTKEIRWEIERSAPDVPSCVIYRDRLYAVQDKGILSCLDLMTGKPFWVKRLSGSVTASPVAAAGNIYVFNEQGRCFVVAAKDEFELVQENETDASILATPAVTGRCLLVRTTEQLLCLEQSAEKVDAATAERD